MRPRILITLLLAVLVACPVLSWGQTKVGMLSLQEALALTLEDDAGTVATDTTDGNGDYSLSLKPGKYIVVEVGQAGCFAARAGRCGERRAAGR